MTGREQAKVSALETFSDSRQWMTGLMYTDMKSQTAYINTKNIRDFWLITCYAFPPGDF